MKWFNYLAAIIFLIYSGLNAQTAAWQVVDEMPYPVSGASAVVFNSVIYILGGYSDSLQSNVNWIQSYNPISGAWDIPGFMRDNRYGLNAHYHDDRILFYGGIEDDSLSSQALEQWNSQVSTISTVVNTNANFDRIFSTGLVQNNNLYIIGGATSSFGGDSSYLPYIVEYNITNSIFTYEEDSLFFQNELPAQQMSVLVDNNIYIFGGVFNGILQSIRKFNTVTHELTPVSITMLEPRAGGVVERYPLTDELFIIGGYNENNNALSTVEVLDQAHELITPGPMLNYARFNLTAVNYDNTIYIFGGEGKEGEIVPYVENLGTALTSTEKHKNIPENYFILLPNYPNPFNPSTTITFELSQSANISLDIFSAAGEHIKKLAQDYLSQGSQSFIWDGSDADGNSVASGIYFYRLSSNTYSVTKKMLLIK